MMQLNNFNSVQLPGGAVPLLPPHLRATSGTSLSTEKDNSTTKQTGVSGRWPDQQMELTLTGVRYMRAR